MELKEDKDIAWSLLGYIFLTMTLAIARMAELAHDEWPSAVYFVGQSLWACEGCFNVILYSTREGVIPWTWNGLVKGIIAFMHSYHPTFWKPGHFERCGSGDGEENIPLDSMHRESLNI